MGGGGGLLGAGGVGSMVAPGPEVLLQQAQRPRETGEGMMGSDRDGLMAVGHLGHLLENNEHIEERT